jgi:hypothetical protein
MDKLPIAIPFHPHMGVSETDMPAVAIQNISDLRKPDHQANITVDSDAYVRKIP